MSVTYADVETEPCMGEGEGEGEGHSAMGPGGEFDVVRRLLAGWGARARGVGDDAAVLDVPAGSQLVASTDTSVEGVHFRREWFSLDEIGYRAAAAALSDLAAMAATPLGMLVAATLPSADPRELEALGMGLGEAAGVAGCPIIGGDTTSGERLSLTISVLGHAPSPMRRSGARPEDLVFVTGRFGGPGAALRALYAGEIPTPADRVRLAHPTPRLAESWWLSERVATSMIDVSDGLVSDARHVAAASGVSMAIDLDRLPVADGVTQFEAAVSGEEYELLVTASGDFDADDFTRRFGIPITRIGRVTGLDSAGSVEFTLGGKRVDPGAGYDHFSR